MPCCPSLLHNHRSKFVELRRQTKIVEVHSHPDDVSALSFDDISCPKKKSDARKGKQGRQLPTIKALTSIFRVDCPLLFALLPGLATEFSTARDVSSLSLSGSSPYAASPVAGCKQSIRT